MDIALGELTKNPRVRKICQIIYGIVEISVVVIHPAHKSSDIVNAGKREAAADHVWMLEQAIRRVVRAERSSHRGNRDAGRLAIVPDEGNHFLADVGVELRLHVAAMEWMSAFVIKPRPVHRIHAKKFHAACVNQRREAADEPLALEFPLVASA